MEDSKPNLINLQDLKDPSFLCCCLIPTIMAIVVVIGLFYRFCQWAFA